MVMQNISFSISFLSFVAECVAGSVSIFSERIKANVALDMQAKMREDPLFAIKYFLTFDF